MKKETKKIPRAPLSTNTQPHWKLRINGQVCIDSDKLVAVMLLLYISISLEGNF